MSDISEISPTARDIVGGPSKAVVRHVARAVAPRSVGNIAKAEWRGVKKSVDWLYGYWNAYDKLDLRMKNPKLHHDICVERRKIVLGWICFFFLVSSIVYATLGPFYTALEVFFALAAVMAVGKEKKPILVQETKYRMGFGETDIRRAVARAVMGWDLDNEKYADHWKQIAVRRPFREVGETMSIRLALPKPTSAVKARVKRVELAAALDLTESQVRVVVDVDKNSAGEFDLIIYSTNPWAIAPTKAPYLIQPVQTNIWDGFPFAIDIDRKSITLELIGKSCLIAGLPEMGKTTTALGILGGCAQDPFVRMWVADAKGVDTPDIIPIAYRYVGASQDELLKVLDEIETWGRKKLSALKEISKVKLDRETCEFYRAIDPNHPLAVVDVLYVDEARFYTKNSSNAINTKVVENLSRIIEMFRAVGIVVIIATQQPSTEVIPSILRNLIRVRIAHATTTPQMSNTILGDGAAGLGYSSATFDEDEKGVAWMRVLKHYRNIRPHYTEPHDFSRSCAFAYGLRERIGTLPEQVDEAMTAQVPSILLEAERIMNAHEWTKAPSYALAEELGKVQAFVGIGVNDLASQMSEHSISPGSIGKWTREDGTVASNLRGYQLAHIQTAIAKAVKEFAE
jgi:hypothetical protein